MNEIIKEKWYRSTKDIPTIAAIVIFQMTDRNRTQHLKYGILYH